MKAPIFILHTACIWKNFKNLWLVTKLWLLKKARRQLQSPSRFSNLFPRIFSKKLLLCVAWPSHSHENFLVAAIKEHYFSQNLPFQENDKKGLPKRAVHSFFLSQGDKKLPSLDQQYRLWEDNANLGRNRKKNTKTSVSVQGVGLKQLTASLFDLNCERCRGDDRRLICLIKRRRAGMIVGLFGFVLEIQSEVHEWDLKGWWEDLNLLTWVEIIRV